MKILMITSETLPFAKSGGLADVVFSLSRSLSSLGHEVKIVLPRYSFIATKGFQRLRKSLQVPADFSSIKTGLWKTTLPGGNVEYYFLENPLYSEKAGIYGDHGSHTYRDNHRRFTLLSCGAFELCKTLSWYPDIFHSHDWPSALAPSYLKRYQKQQVLFLGAASVLTIHNIGYQGIFPRHDIHTTRLFWEECDNREPFYNSTLNFLRCGIVNADIINTVSPTYSREIKTPAYGHGMEEILCTREDNLYGILNGVDYEEWDPKTDPYIPAPFSSNDLRGKLLAKEALQKECRLPVREDIPVIGIVSRLVEQKGFRELCNPKNGSLKRICSQMAVQVVVLGTGEGWIEKELLELAKILPNLKVFLTFSNSMAHLIEGGSDFFLMPSRYEPCGLNQIYSLRYGTLPVVRKTGGLADTVENYDPATGTGTGFVFNDLTPESIYNTVEWAVSTWYDRKDHIAGMIKQAMERHFSWDDAASEYQQLYEKAVLVRESVPAGNSV